jgi:hypothetical protein
LWIPVLLLACQYGTAAGLSAAAVAIAIHLLADVSPQASLGDMYDYHSNLWREPILWLLAALVFGSFRSQQQKASISLQARLLEASEKLQTTGDLAYRLRGHVEALERQILCSKDRSVEAGLRALEAVRHSPREQLSHSLSHALAVLLGGADYAIYGRNDGGWMLERDMAGSTGIRLKVSLPDELPQALRRAMVERKDLLTVRDASDARLLGSMGLIAAPIMPAGTGSLIGVLLIRQMDPLRLDDDAELAVRALCRELATPLSADRVLVNLNTGRIQSAGLPGSAPPLPTLTEWPVRAAGKFLKGSA